MRRSQTLWAALVALLSAPALAQAQQPAGIASLMQRTQGALASGDVTKMAPLTTDSPAAAFAWALRPGVRGVAHQWKVGALQAPGGHNWYAVCWGYLPCESQGDHVFPIVRAEGGWKLGGEILETSPLGFRLRDHQIRVRIHPATHMAYFSNRVQCERMDPAARTMQMRLSADFPVDAINCNGRRVPFTQLGGVIYLTAPPQPHFALDMQYHGSAYHVGMFVGNYLTAQEMVLAAYWYPTIARLPTTHGVTITVPAGWTAIAQGNLIKRAVSRDGVTFSYRMPVPNCYFTLDAGPYYHYQNTVKGRTYSVYLLVPDAARGNKQVTLMDASFRLFESLWGSYPFNHYAIVETQQHGWPGALEAYTFTTYGTGLMPSSNPHEWGHTWWGGFVPNTYLQDIWNESFASYSESVFERYGSDQITTPQTRNRLLWHRATTGLAEAVSQVPMSKSADSLYGPSAASGYTKGTLVLQNLEELLGFDQMQRCLLAFRRAFDGSERAATWTDFERIVDEVTGVDYRWWFEQWVDRTGLPKLSWKNVTATQGADGYTVAADLVQDGPVYRLSVPVWLVDSAGNTNRSVVETSGQSTHVVLSCASAPDKLMLDPEMRLPRTLTGEDVGGGAPSMQKLVAVVGEGASALGDRLRSFGITVLHASAVNPKDLGGKTLLLLGNAATNSLWGRYASACPFDASAGAVVWNGKTYPGAQAIASTASPADTTQRAYWLDVRSQGIDMVQQALNGAHVLIFDSSSQLVDGAPAVVAGGPSVHTFTR